MANIPEEQLDVLEGQERVDFRLREEPNIAANPNVKGGLTGPRAAMAALVAVGASLIAVPAGASEYTYVTAGGRGVHAILGAQDAGGETTPGINFELPSSIPGNIGAVTVTNDDSVVVTVADGPFSTASLVVLKLNSSDEFEVDGQIDGLAAAFSLEVGDDGWVVVTGGDDTIGSGSYRFDPNNPNDTFEVITEVSDASMFKTEPFTDENGNQCYLVAGDSNTIKLIAETPEGSVETDIAIPSYMRRIIGLEISNDQSKFVVTHSSGGTVTAVDFSSNPSILQANLADGEDSTIDQATSSPFVLAAHTGTQYVTVDDMGSIALINTDNAARDELNVGQNTGAVLVDTNDDGIDDQLVVHGGAVAGGMQKISVIDLEGRFVDREILVPSGTSTGRLDVTVASSELANLTDADVVSGMHVDADPAFTLTEDGPTTLIASVDLSAISSPGDSVSFSALTEAAGGGEHEVAIELGDETIPLVAVGTGFGSDMTHMNDGTVRVCAEIFGDGRLGQSGLFVADSDMLLEGSNDTRYCVTGGSYDTLLAQQNGIDVGDDDDSVGVDDDDGPETPGNTGCSVSDAGPGTSAQLAIFGVLGGAAGRRKRKRRAARKK